MFEFDPAMRATNAAKHGIESLEAQALWDDPNLISLGVLSYDGETRHLFVGRIGRRCWTAVVTYRGERTRIISVRRARRPEEATYDDRRI
jgi:hypothetical protein